jgi:uncharacterized protein YkwD
LVVAVLVTGTASKTGAADISRRDRMLHLLNQTRRNHDLPVFRLNRDLSISAYRHSKRMAEQNRLFHTDDLYRLLRSYHPSTWGENVGMAGRLRRVKELWMHSSGHRANILRRAFRRVGVGAIEVRGSVWVTVIFYGG